MRADYSVSCESKRYEFGYYWAVGMIFLYPIGCPLIFAYFIVSYHRSQHNLSQGPNRVSDPPINSFNAIQSLCSAYKPQFWWWEILETTQRLLLTGILVLIAQGSAIQIVIGALLTLSFLYLYARYEPFQDEFVLAIKIVSYWQIFFVFWIALLIKADFNSIDSSLLGILLLFSLFINLFYDTLKILSWMTLSRWNPSTRDQMMTGTMTTHEDEKGLEIILSPMATDVSQEVEVLEEGEREPSQNPFQLSGGNSPH
jgi:hypothetical protein